MDTKWKKSKAVVGFICFLLGVSLLLEGVLYFGTIFTSSNSRAWVYDSFKSDWRRTREFQNFVSNRLERLIMMGAGGGGQVYRYNGSAGGLTQVQTRADTIHSALKEDKNVLYRVEKSGEVLYSNADSLSPDTDPSALISEGYAFLLQFDGEKVRIWLDGEEQNVYGGGYYRFEEREGSYQWYVPGYKNFTVDEAGSKVKVTMAVINSPQIFIKGSYGSTGSDQYNELYYTKQGLDQWREQFTSHALRMALGLGLFLVYLLLRRGKKQADMALARGTGKLWFEVKILAALLVLYFFLPRTTYLRQIWNEMIYAYAPSSYGSTSAAAEAFPGFNGDIIAELEQQGVPPEEIEAALSEYGYDRTYSIEQSASIGTAVTVLTENGGWLLREYLTELSSHTGHLLALLWGFYLLIFNDWRYNRRPWKQGVIAMLCAWGLDLPLQRRLSRVCGATALTVLILEAVSLDLFAWTVRFESTRLALLIITIPAVLVLLACIALIWRLRRLWTDFGAVADQAAAIRAGELESELTLQEGSDLAQLADDLNHIRQGLHQAVEERTHSERMKVELVTNVSHDLKTPLTSIISYTELLSQEPLEPPASEYVKIMGEKAQRLKAMVQDVFEVSKAASGQLPVKLERLDYGRLLRQTLADMAQAIEDSGLALRTDIPDTEVPITADSDRMYRVFQNLIGNALKYSLPGSRVYLSLSVEGGIAAASVRSTSAAELMPGTDYTARFVRGDESRTDGGSGLGLSIADSFTRACGGTLTVTTQADLFTVTVSFPVL